MSEKLTEAERRALAASVEPDAEIHMTLDEVKAKWAAATPVEIADGPLDDTSSDEILRDPVRRKRILDSLAQARYGQTRPIEEYWAESDPEDG